ncbi:MAG TPA: LytTR family DNA-binding domain-containing protein [Sphingomonadaceae bacterium]|nr:LytTR family DNA-binding domain-containing protein [Sphingomonadaceae bacterium]
MRLLLVDDEPLALDRLRVALRGMPDVEVAGVATDGVEALEQIEALRPDLVLLDIQMPGITGMAVAEVLREQAARPEIVFVTAFNRFAPDAFDVEAADYLLKPVDFDRLRTAIARARRRRSLRDAEGRAAELDAVVVALRADAARGESQTDAGQVFEDGIWVPGRNGAVRVPVDTIDWIEAARDYVMLNTPLKSHILRATMNQMEERLDPGVMTRIHRSHMVRIAAVNAVERPGRGMLRLILADDVKLQVGPNYIEAICGALKLD